MKSFNLSGKNESDNPARLPRAQVEDGRVLMSSVISDIISNLRHCHSNKQVGDFLDSIPGMQYLNIGAGTHFYAGYAFSFSLSDVHAKDARVIPYANQLGLIAAPEFIDYLQPRGVNILVVRYAHCETGILEPIQGLDSSRVVSEQAKKSFLHEMLLLANHPLEGEGIFQPDNPGIIHANATRGLGTYLLNPRGDIVLNGWYSAEFATQEAFRSLRRNLQANLNLI